MSVTFYPQGPIAIRDGTFARVQAIPGLANVFKARAMPVQDGQMPCAVVWNAGERTGPNGDANTGAPEFIHNLTIVIDILVKAGTEGVLDSDIVLLTETVRATLLSDLTWIEMFEGIERCDTRYSYPKEAADLMAQAMIEFEVTYRSIWQPITPNDLKEVAVFAKPPRPPITCGFCQADNAGDRASCRVCGGPLPQSQLEPIVTTIKLESCS